MTPKIQMASSSETERLISTFLAEHYSGVVATADTAANPHAAVVYYLSQPDFTLSFVTKSETQKYKNIEENKQVSFVIYDEKTQTTLQISGHVVAVEEIEEKRETIRNMTNTSIALSGQLLPPAYKLTAGDYMVLKLIPAVMKMAIYARSEETEDLYETLLFSDS